MISPMLYIAKGELFDKALLSKYDPDMKLVFQQSHSYALGSTISDVELFISTTKPWFSISKWPALKPRQ